MLRDGQVDLMTTSVSVHPQLADRPDLHRLPVDDHGVERGLAAFVRRPAMSAVPGGGVGLDENPPPPTKWQVTGGL